jgi:hypothetical protein
MEFSLFSLRLLKQPARVFTAFLGQVSNGRKPVLCLLKNVG